MGIINHGELIVEGTLKELKENTTLYLYHVSLQGNFAIPKSWERKYSVRVIHKTRKQTEFEVNAKSRNGLSEILRDISGSKADLLFFQKKREDLEEVFLRSLKRDGTRRGAKK